jgi:hypothetical protein
MVHVNATTPKNKVVGRWSIYLFLIIRKGKVEWEEKNQIMLTCVIDTRIRTNEN